MGIKRGTAWSIISRYQATGLIEKKQGGARRRKVDEDMTRRCVEFVDDHSEYTLRQIKEELELTMPEKPRSCLFEHCIGHATWPTDNCEKARISGN